MKVSEMVAALLKMPQDVEVRIEGYFPDTPDGAGASAAFVPNHIEALQNEITGVHVVLWAIGATEDDALKL